MLPMKFSSESDLVDAYQSYLQARGIPTRAEVSCGKGFAADLVSRETVWEAKLILDREHLYQAFGQGESYRQFLKRPKLAIFGLSPEVNKAQAVRIAKWLCERHQHLWIGFVDDDKGFVNYCKYYGLIKEKEHVGTHQASK